MAGLFGSKQTIANTQPKFDELRIQSSAQGHAIPIVFGKTRISSNLLWYQDFTATPHTTNTSGGKGGGVNTSSTTYTYSAAVIFGLMEGPSVAANFIGTVWSGKVVTDATKLGLSQYNGSYTQTPLPYATSKHPTEALGYRGTAYAASGALDLKTSDGLPNLSFEVTGLLGSTDVNLADIMQSVLTSDKFGAGWPPAQLGSLADFSAYCAAAGFVASPAYVAQQPCHQIVTELCLIGNSAPFWSEGLMKVKPYADQTVGTYVPDLTVQYNLGYDDFLAAPGEPPVKVMRKRQADAFNQVQIKCLNRPYQYNPYIAEAKDQWNIDVYGLRPMPQIVADAICDPNVGRAVAQTILQRQLYLRNTYEFSIGWRYARLEPMDIVTLTDPLLGLNLTKVRITSIDENDSGDMLIVAEELSAGVSTPGSYAIQPTTGTTPAGGVDPGNTYAPVIFQPPLALSGTPQVWLGAAGGPNWGGADVWVSTDGGSSYSRLGSLTNPARFGVLTANFPAGVDPDTVNTLSVDLTGSLGSLVPASSASADALATLSYVDGEIVAYSAATLTTAYNYSLGTYIRRGQGGTKIAAHAIGTKFMRLDSAVGQFSVSPALYGTTIYVKLLSYNTSGGALQSLASVAPTSFLIAAQAATGNGFSFVADRSSTVMADPGPGKMRFNSASQASATTIAFDALTNDGANMVAYFSTVGSSGYLDLRDLADTTKWATYTLNGSNAPAGYQTFGVTYKAGGSEIPNGDTVIASFSPTPPTGVTSVGMSMPSSILTVSGSPVTTTGNLTATLVTQNAATVFAGPLAGNALAPTFRPLATTDIPPGANTQVLTTQNGAVVWANASSSGFANQAANTLFAGPTTGNAAAPAFRALVAADVPFVLSNPMTTTGDLIVAGAAGVPQRLPQGANGQVLGVVAGAVAWTTAGSGGAGTVKVTATNVALGTQAASQTAFNYTTVPTIAARGMVSLFKVTASAAGQFDLVIRGAAADTGSLWLQAVSIGQSTYLMTLPIYYENDAAAQDFFVGIRNSGPNPVTFTLTNLRIEKFA